MTTSRPDRVVSVLTTIVSIAYFGLWVAAVVALIAAPAAKLFAAGDAAWTWGLEVPAVVLDSQETVLTPWGPAQLVVDDVRGRLLLPISHLPWGWVAVLWMHAAVVFALMLLSLYHLRRIFQRVRDGAPFDAYNALRMRWLGLLLFTLVVFNGLTEFAASRAVVAGSSSGDISVAGAPRFELLVAFLAFILVALAEIFRRGAELEEEQSLVI